MAAGLDAIAITDHNTADWCDEVAEASEGTPLVVLPGVEITTTEGHLLAIWEEGTPARIVNECLIRLGIDGDDQGKLNISAEVGLGDAAKRITKSGGLAIAAHADQNKGLLELPVAAHVRQTLLNQHLAAIEIVDSAKAAAVQRKVGQSRELAFVRGSDMMEPGQSGHRLSAIGNRRTWIKASCPDLCGLRHAFGDPALRIKIEEPGESRHAHIASLAIDGGFLDGIEVRFSTDLNCLVGGTGTGKSLAIECIRFALDQQVDGASFPHIHQEVASRLSEALGNGSTVKIDVVGEDGEKYLIERPFVEDSPTDWVVRRYIEDGNLVGIDCHPSEIIKISAFSQGEALEYSREKVGRMALVDASLELTSIEIEIERLIQQLHENGEQLLEQRARVAELQDKLTSKESLSQQLEELESIFEGDIVKSQKAWEIDNSTINAILTCLPDKRVKRLKLTPEVEEPQIKENEDLIGEAIKIIQTANGEIAEALAVVDTALDKARAKAQDVRERWEERYGEFESELTQTLDSVPGKKSLNALRRQLKKTQRDLLEIDEARRAIDKTEQPLLDQLAGKREKILKKVMKAQQRRRKLRRNRIKELNHRMSGIVKLDLPSTSDRTAFRKKLNDIKVGSRVNEKTLDAIAANIHPAQLVTAMLDNSYTDLANPKAGVTLEALSRLFVTITDKNLWNQLLRVQEIDTPDRLEIKFMRESGDYAPIESLAHGQKCTAIIVVQLADGQNPVIIDQPEDALHAPWIEDHLVDRLRSLRDQRQYIFATRSPGIVVSADAEQILTMRANAGQGSIEASGSLERHDLNKLVLHHLEGGPQALIRRHRKLLPSLNALPKAAKTKGA